MTVHEYLIQINFLTLIVYKINIPNAIRQGMLGYIESWRRIPKYFLLDRWAETIVFSAGIGDFFRYM
jgi:hypothetical protein